MLTITTDDQTRIEAHARAYDDHGRAVMNRWLSTILPPLTDSTTRAVAPSTNIGVGGTVPPAPLFELDGTQAGEGAIIHRLDGVGQFAGECMACGGATFVGFDHHCAGRPFRKVAAKPVIIQGLSDGPCSTHNEIYGTGGFVVVRDGAVKPLPTAPNESKGTREASGGCYRERFTGSVPRGSNEQ